MVDDDQPDTHTSAAPTAAAAPVGLAYSAELPPDSPTDVGPGAGGWSWGAVAGIAGLIITLGMIVAALVWLVGRPETRHAVAADVAQPSSATAPDGPSDPADIDFIQQLNEWNVPIHDWRDSVSRARIACDTITEGGWPRGSTAVDVMFDVVGKFEPDWTSAQVRHSGSAALNSYCPQLWPYSDDELAAMSPDDRFVAMVESSTTIWASDNPGLVGWGHQICADLGSGVRYRDLVAQINGTNSGNRGWEDNTASRLVDAAITVHCPNAA